MPVLKACFHDLSVRATLAATSPALLFVQALEKSNAVKESKAAYGNAWNIGN